jgi:hypothetical protein
MVNSSTFIHVGYLSTVDEFAHLWANVSVNPVVQGFNDAVNGLATAWNVARSFASNQSTIPLALVDAKYQKLHGILIEAEKELSQLCKLTKCTETFTNVAYVESILKTRDKRFVGELLGGISLGLSVYTQLELIKLKKDIQAAKVINAKVLHNR